MVSVVIPVYNRERTIEKAMQSVLEQTYSDLELIIVDDGSTDKTREIVKNVTDPRVKYIYQDNMGACVARNHGIDEADGDYIAFQDSDDVWHKDKIEKQLQIFSTHENVDIVCCQTQCLRLDGSVFLSGENIPKGLLDRENYPGGITTQTLVMKREITDNVRFDPKVTRYQDLDFLLTAQKNYSIYCVADSLVDRYIGEDSITNHPERIYEMAEYFEKKYPEKMQYKKGNIAQFFSAALVEASCQIKKTDGLQPRKYYAKALKLNPSIKTIAKVVACSVRIYPIYLRIARKTKSI